MIIEHFAVTRDNLTINGLAYLQNNGEIKSPTIILSHGFLCDYTGFEYFATRFCEHGYNVFCYNFCGGSRREDFEYKSEGDSRDMTIATEISDLEAVYSYAISKSYVNKDEIYLMGESQGAFVSGLTAAKLQEKIKKLIMIFPAVCIPDHARRGCLGFTEYDPMNPPMEMESELTTLGRGFHDGVVMMDAYSELAKYKGETLIIQGDADAIVVPQYQYLVKDMFDKNDATDKKESKSTAYEELDSFRHRCHLQLVRGLPHSTDNEYRDVIFESAIKFIEGKREILTFRTIVTKVISLDDNDRIVNSNLVHKQDVYFTGYCDSELFRGTITEGIDHQEYRNGECLGLNAAYTFSGTDIDRNYCELHVVNSNKEGYFKPIIKTESKALGWLNEADLSAIVEGGPDGPTIRIFL